MINLKKNMTVQQVIKALTSEKTRSVFGKAVINYAVEMLENSELKEIRTLEDVINLTGYPVKSLGDRSYKVENRVLDLYNAIREVCLKSSYGGNFIIYDDDIAKELLTPSQYKKHAGKKGYIDSSYFNIRNNITWLDLQAQALEQAIYKIKYIVKL